MPERDIEEQVLHDHILKVLKKEHYNYPNPSHPRLMTYLNHPSKTKSLFTIDRMELTPDIIVIDTQADRVVAIAEVETESTVGPEEEPEWASFRRLDVRLHLYVPKGLGARAAELCRGYKNTELIEYSKHADRYLLERYAAFD